MSPAKTLPRLTPTRTGSRRSPSSDLAQRQQHPLLVVADDPRRAGRQHQRRRRRPPGRTRAGRPRARSAARWTSTTSSWSASAATSMPSLSISSVEPRRSAGRRSSRCGARTAAGPTRTLRAHHLRQARRDQLERRVAQRRLVEGDARAAARRAARPVPSPRRGSARGIAAAVSALSRICPAPAAFSMPDDRRGRRADDHELLAVRSRRPARGGSRPLWMPCEIRSVTLAGPAVTRPISRSVARMPVRPRRRRAPRAPRARTAAQRVARRA